MGERDVEGVGAAISLECALQIVSVYIDGGVCVCVQLPVLLDAFVHAQHKPNTADFVLILGE